MTGLLMTKLASDRYEVVALGRSNAGAAAGGGFALIGLVTATTNATIGQVVVGLGVVIAGALIAVSALRSAVIIDFSNAQVLHRQLITRRLTLAKGDTFTVKRTTYPTPRSILALSDGVLVRPLAAVTAASDSNRTRLADVVGDLNRLLRGYAETS